MGLLSALQKHWMALKVDPQEEVQEEVPPLWPATCALRKISLATSLDFF